MTIWYRFCLSLSWLIAKVIFGTRVYGLENVPKKGGFILASNHISLYDPPIAGSQARRELGFFTKSELFETKLIGAFLRSVNSLPVKRGTVDRQSIRLAVDSIHRGLGLAFYPEGTRSKTDQFLPAKPGIGLVAVRANCSIIPTYITGFNRLKDCLLRKTHATVTFGKPFSAEWVMSHPTNKQGYVSIAEAVMARIAQIRDQGPIVK